MLTIEELAAKLRQDYTELDSWGWVAKENKISKPLAWRIANKGYEPKNPYIRRRLGLPVYLPAVTCEQCGEVHTVPWCTKEAGIKPVKTNGRSQPHRTPPVRVGECSNEEWAAIKRLTPAERKRRLLGG